jgi:CBS domain-containing protein
MERTVARLLEEKGHEVWTIGPDATVFEALEVMAARHIGALVIVDDGDKPCGILSERDYARKVILLDRGSRETAVSDIMTSELLTVTTRQTTADCMGLMTDHRIRHLPVVEDNRLIGIVSIGDVVRAVIEEQRFLIEQLEGYITG